MRTTILVTIDSQAKCLVDRGDTIAPGKAIAEKKIRQTIETVNIAKLLRIKPDKIAKYLKKSIGSKVEKNDVLAVKKSLFRSYILKSHVAGALKEIDVKKGTLSITAEVDSSAKAQKITFPMKGKVVSCGKTQIEIEIDAPFYKGEAGEGNTEEGPLLHLKGEKITILDVPAAAFSSLILANQIGYSVLTKLDVLEAKGLIVTHRPRENILPWIQVADSVYDKLIPYSGRRVWLRPREKEIIIIE